MMEKTNSNSLLNGSSRMIWAFLGGAASGAVLAYLTSPRSGAENRRALRDAVDNSVASVKKLPTVARESATSLASAAKEKLSQTSGRASGRSKKVALEVSAPETSPSLASSEADPEKS